LQGSIYLPEISAIFDRASTGVGVKIAVTLELLANDALAAQALGMKEAEILINNDLTPVNGINQLMHAVAKFNNPSAARILAEQLMNNDKKDQFNWLQEYKSELAVNLIGDIKDAYSQRSVLPFMMRAYMNETNEWVRNAFELSFNKILREDKNKAAFEDEIARLEINGFTNIRELYEFRALKQLTHPDVLTAQAKAPKVDLFPLLQFVNGGFEFIHASGIFDLEARKTFHTLINRINGFISDPYRANFNAPYEGSDAQNKMNGKDDQTLLNVLLNVSHHETTQMRVGAAIELAQNRGNLRLKTDKLLLVIKNSDEQEEIVQASLWALLKMGPAIKSGHIYLPSEGLTQVALSGRTEVTRVLSMLILPNSNDINIDSQMAKVLLETAAESKPELYAVAAQAASRVGTQAVEPLLQNLSNEQGHWWNWYLFSHTLKIVEPVDLQGGISFHSIVAIANKDSNKPTVVRMIEEQVRQLYIEGRFGDIRDKILPLLFVVDPDEYKQFTDHMWKRFYLLNAPQSYVEQTGDLITGDDHLLATSLASSTRFDYNAFIAFESLKNEVNTFYRASIGLKALSPEDEKQLNDREKIQKLLLIISNPDEKEEIVQIALVELLQMGPGNRTGENYLPSETLTLVALSPRSELTRVLAMYELGNSTDIKVDDQMSKILDEVSTESRPDLYAAAAHAATRIESDTVNPIKTVDSMLRVLQKEEARSWFISQTAQLIDPLNIKGAASIRAIVAIAHWNKDKYKNEIVGKIRDEYIKQLVEHNQIKDITHKMLVLLEMIDLKAANRVRSGLKNDHQGLMGWDWTARYVFGPILTAVIVILGLALAVLVLWEFVKKILVKILALQIKYYQWKVARALAAAAKSNKKGPGQPFPTYFLNPDGSRSWAYEVVDGQQIIDPRSEDIPVDQREIMIIHEKAHLDNLNEVDSEALALRAHLNYVIVTGGLARHIDYMKNESIKIGLYPTKEYLNLLDQVKKAQKLSSIKDRLDGLKTRTPNEIQPAEPVAPKKKAEIIENFEYLLETHMRIAEATYEKISTSWKTNKISANYIQKLEMEIILNKIEEIIDLTFPNNVEEIFAHQPKIFQVYGRMLLLIEDTEKLLKEQLAGDEANIKKWKANQGLWETRLQLRQLLKEFSVLEDHIIPYTQAVRAIYKIQTLMTRRFSKYKKRSNLENIAEVFVRYTWFFGYQEEIDDTINETKENLRKIMGKNANTERVIKEWVDKFDEVDNLPTLLPLNQQARIADTFKEDFKEQRIKRNILALLAIVYIGIKWGYYWSFDWQDFLVFAAIYYTRKAYKSKNPIIVWLNPKKHIEATIKKISKSNRIIQQWNNELMAREFPKHRASSLPQLDLDKVENRTASSMMLKPQAPPSYHLSITMIDDVIQIEEFKKQAEAFKQQRGPDGTVTFPGLWNKPIALMIQKIPGKGGGYLQARSYLHGVGTIGELWEKLSNDPNVVILGKEFYQGKEFGEDSWDDLHVIEQSNSLRVVITLDGDRGRQALIQDVGPALRKYGLKWSRNFMQLIEGRGYVPNWLFRLMDANNQLENERMKNLGTKLTYHGDGIGIGRFGSPEHNDGITFATMRLTIRDILLGGFGVIDADISTGRVRNLFEKTGLGLTYVKGWVQEFFKHAPGVKFDASNYERRLRAYVGAIKELNTKDGGIDWGRRIHETYKFVLAYNFENKVDAYIAKKRWLKQYERNMLITFLGNNIYRSRHKEPDEQNLVDIDSEEKISKLREDLDKEAKATLDQWELDGSIAARLKEEFMGAWGMEIGFDLFVPIIQKSYDVKRKIDSVNVARDLREQPKVFRDFGDRLYGEYKRLFSESQRTELNRLDDRNSVLFYASPDPYKAVYTKPLSLHEDPSGPSLAPGNIYFQSGIFAAFMGLHHTAPLAIVIIVGIILLALLIKLSIWLISRLIKSFQNRRALKRIKIEENKNPELVIAKARANQQLNDFLEDWYRNISVRGETVYEDLAGIEHDQDAVSLRGIIFNAVTLEEISPEKINAMLATLLQEREAKMVLAKQEHAKRYGSKVGYRGKMKRIDLVADLVPGAVPADAQWGARFASVKLSQQLFLDFLVKAGIIKAPPQIEKIMVSPGKDDAIIHEGVLYVGDMLLQNISLEQIYVHEIVELMSNDDHTKARQFELLSLKQNTPEFRDLLRITQEREEIQQRLIQHTSELNIFEGRLRSLTKTAPIKLPTTVLPLPLPPFVPAPIVPMPVVPTPPPAREEFETSQEKRPILTFAQAEPESMLRKLLALIVGLFSGKPKKKDKNSPLYFEERAKAKNYATKKEKILLASIIRPFTEQLREKNKGIKVDIAPGLKKASRVEEINPGEYILKLRPDALELPEEFLEIIVRHEIRHILYDKADSFDEEEEEDIRKEEILELKENPKLLRSFVEYLKKNQKQSTGLKAPEDYLQDLMAALDETSEADRAPDMDRMFSSGQKPQLRVLERIPATASPDERRVHHITAPSPAGSETTGTSKPVAKPISKAEEKIINKAFSPYPLWLRLAQMIIEGGLLAYGVNNSDYTGGWASLIVFLPWLKFKLMLLVAFLIIHEFTGHILSSFALGGGWGVFSPANLRGHISIREWIWATFVPLRVLRVSPLVSNPKVPAEKRKYGRGWSIFVSMAYMMILIYGGHGAEALLGTWNWPGILSAVLVLGWSLFSDTDNSPNKNFEECGVITMSWRKPRKENLETLKQSLEQDILPDWVEEAIDEMIQIMVVRGGQSGGLALIVRGTDGRTRLIIAKIVKPKRANLSAVLRSKLRKDLRKAIAQGYVDKEGIRGILGHVRFATQGKSKEAEAHPFGVMDEKVLEKIFTWVNGQEIEEEDLVALVGAMNGDFDFLKTPEWQQKPGEEMELEVTGKNAVWSWILDRVLFENDPTDGDANKLVRTVALMFTQGRWYAAARLGVLFGLIKNVDEIFGGDKPSKNGPRTFVGNNDAESRENLKKIAAEAYDLYKNKGWQQLLSRPDLHKEDKSFVDIWVTNEMVKKDPSLQFQLELINQFKAALVERMMRNEVVLRWNNGNDQRDFSRKVGRLVDIMVEAFFENDLDIAVRKFAKRAVGLTGIAVRSSLNNDTAFYSRTQAISFAYNLQKGAASGCSMDLALQATGLYTDRFDLNSSGDGEFAYIKHTDDDAYPIAVRIYSTVKQRELSEKEVLARRFALNKSNPFWEPLIKYSSERSRTIQSMEDSARVLTNVRKAWKKRVNARRPETTQRLTAGNIFEKLLGVTIEKVYKATAEAQVENGLRSSLYKHYQSKEMKMFLDQETYDEFMAKITGGLVNGDPEKGENQKANVVKYIQWQANDQIEKEADQTAGGIINGSIPLYGLEKRRRAFRESLKTSVGSFISGAHAVGVGAAFEKAVEELMKAKNVKYNPKQSLDGVEEKHRKYDPRPGQNLAERVDDSGIRTLNPGEIDRIVKNFVERVSRIKEFSALKDTIDNSHRRVDIILVGFEVPLYLLKIFENILGIMIPGSSSYKKITVRSVEHNDFLDDPYGSGFHHRSIVILGSKSGDNAGTKKVAEVLQAVIPGRVFAITGRVDSPISRILGLEPNKPFPGTIISTCANFRTEQPSTVATYAMYLTLL